MSKKDYVALAEALRKAANLLQDTWTGDMDVLYQEIINAIVACLAADNPRFDAARFRAACLQMPRGGG